MASLRKRADSKYWVACIIDKNGRRLQKSTKLTNRKQAQRLADELESIYRNEVSARKYLELIREAHKSATGQEEKGITFGQYVELFLKAKEPEVKPSTFHFYQGAAREFAKWLGERGDKDLNSISKDDLVNYRHDLAKRLAPKTVNHNLVFVKYFFKLAKMENHIHENPAENLMRVKVEKGESIRRPFTDKELQAVLDVAEPEWKSMVLFGLYTGQRLGDLAKYK